METQETLSVFAGPETGDRELEKRIIALARERFLGRGFSTVRTEDLAKELGISKKTLYRLFESKNQLVMEVATSLTRDIEEEIGPIFDGPAPFPEKFRSILAGVARHVGSISGYFMADLGRYAPEVWAEIDRFRRERVLGRLKGVIDQGREEGSVRPDVDPELFVTIIYTVAQNVFTPEGIMKLGISPKEMVAFVLRLFSLGILTEKGRSHLENGEQNNE